VGLVNNQSVQVAGTLFGNLIRGLGTIPGGKSAKRGLDNLASKYEDNIKKAAQLTSKQGREADRVLPEAEHLYKRDATIDKIRDSRIAKYGDEINWRKADPRGYDKVNGLYEKNKAKFDNVMAPSSAIDKEISESGTGFWGQAKVVGGAAKHYMTSGPLTEIMAKHAVLASPGILGVGYRYATGGTMARTADGQSDIAGIPFF